MKRQTVRFYTDSGLYKGWCFLNYHTYHTEIIGWIRSGNKVKINDMVINWINRTKFFTSKTLNNLIKD